MRKEEDMQVDTKISTSTKVNFSRNPRTVPNKEFKPTAYQKQVLLGSMLGAGGVYPNSQGNCEYREVHSTLDTEYLKWKKHIFASMGATLKAYKNNCVLRIPPNTLFNKYRKNFYGTGNKKLITREALSDLTALGLTVWFMDDGLGNEEKLSLTINYTQLDAQDIVREYFLSKFNIEVGKTPLEIYFGKEESLRLAKIFLQHIHPTLYYKVGNLLKKHLPDIHLSAPPVPNIAINRVGVEGVFFPLKVITKEGVTQDAPATFNMFASLAGHDRGSNMSRFTEVLTGYIDKPLGGSNFFKLLQKVQHKLISNDAYISAAFPYFISKKSPATQIKQYLKHNCKFIGILQNKKDYKFVVEVEALVGNYCPCSKAMATIDPVTNSGFGAHAQRCKIILQVMSSPMQPGVWIEDLIKIIESSGSAELYSVLKRPDEQFVTARGYGNPKFTEDVGREVIFKVQQMKNAVWARVKTEAQESIHPHQAVSYIATRKEGNMWIPDQRGFY